VEREIAFHETLRQAIEDTEVLFDLADEADDEDTRTEAIGKLEDAEGLLADAELRRILGGEHDGLGAIVSVNAGAGGTDACDWAEMLLRMYLRWCERRGFEAELLDRQDGDEAGIRSATVTVSGDHAFGYLKVEEGVHRLVRISPFDAQHRRHTAFASVSVIPAIDDSIEVEIDEKDLRVDQAMKVLRARLYEHARREQEERLAAMRGEKQEIGFGSQIRSYTLHPSQRVKDHRTGVEMGNAEGVLDGDLDRFIRATLLAKAGDGGAS
jgi:peptide chain release factor 2